MVSLNRSTLLPLVLVCLLCLVGSRAWQSVSHHGIKIRNSMPYLTSKTIQGDFDQSLRLTIDYRQRNLGNNKSFGLPRSRSDLRHLSMSSMDESIDKSIDKSIAKQSMNNKLASFGQSGLLAYGFLNFCYYTFTLLVAWFTINDQYRKDFAILSLGQRYKVTLSRFAKIVAVVWAGSQVTKAFRISGSVFLAPYFDKLILSFQKRFHLSSRNKAFSILASTFLLTTIGTYGCLVLLNVVIQ